MLLTTKFSILSIYFLYCICSINSQQQVLTTEFIETLFQILSPVCKNELETALGSKGDITNQCKEEIQNAIMEYGPERAFVKSNSNLMNNVETEEDAFINNNNKPNIPSQNISSPPLINPVYSIAIFVLIVSAITVGLIYCINLQRKTLPISKPKKISKKKVHSNYNYLIIKFS